MIRTRYGSELEILAADPETGAVDARRILDGRFMATHRSELRADGGAEELDAAIEAAPRIPEENLRKGGSE